MAQNYWIGVYDRLNAIVNKYEDLRSLLTDNPDIEVTAGEIEDGSVFVEYEDAEFQIEEVLGWLEVDSNFTITGEWRAPETININELRRWFED